MAVRSKGPLAGFGWLKQGFNLGHGNPRAVLGGAALILLASLLPTLVTMPLQLALEPSPGVMGATFALSMLGALFLVPVFAGYMRVIAAIDRGQPARASDVFLPYRRGETLRLAGYGLAMLAVYAVMVMAILAVAGLEVGRWYMALVTAQSTGVAPAAAAGLPEGIGTAVALGLVFGLLVTGIYSISLGQVALGGHSVLGAVRDGVLGSLKNLLPLLVLAVSGIVVGLVLMLVIALVAMLLALVTSTIAPWLMMALMIPLYIGLLLALYVVMFGVMYHLWRDVCGADEAGTPQDEPLAA